jgi:hypothetical protein
MLATVTEDRIVFRRTVVPAITAVLGMVIGGASVEYLHRHHDHLTREAFAQRARCKELADKYIHDYTDNDTGLRLEKADFSEAHNTCFAAIHSYTSLGATTEEGWELVDLLSGEVTDVGSCNLQVDCGYGRDMRYIDRLNTLFKSEIDGTKPPRDFRSE